MQEDQYQSAEKDLGRQLFHIKASRVWRLNLYETVVWHEVVIKFAWNNNFDLRRAPVVLQVSMESLETRVWGDTGHECRRLPSNLFPQVDTVWHSPTTIDWWRLSQHLYYNSWYRWKRTFHSAKQSCLVEKGRRCGGCHCGKFLLIWLHLIARSHIKQLDVLIIRNTVNMENGFSQKPAAISAIR